MRLLRHVLLTVDDHADGALDAADGAVFDVADDQAAGVDDAVDDAVDDDKEADGHKTKAKRHKPPKYPVPLALGDT